MKRRGRGFAGDEADVNAATTGGRPAAVPRARRARQRDASPSAARWLGGWRARLGSRASRRRRSRPRNTPWLCPVSLGQRTMSVRALPLFALSGTSSSEASVRNALRRRYAYYVPERARRGGGGPRAPRALLEGAPVAPAATRSRARARADGLENEHARALPRRALRARLCTSGGVGAERFASQHCERLPPPADALLAARGRVARALRRVAARDAVLAGTRWQRRQKTRGGGRRRAQWRRASRRRRVAVLTARSAHAARVDEARDSRDAVRGQHPPRQVARRRARSSWRRSCRARRGRRRAVVGAGRATPRRTRRASA